MSVCPDTLWDPFDVSMSGHSDVIRFEAIDRDMIDDDPIASGSFDLLDVVRRCEHLVVSGTGGTIRVLAVRAQ